MNMFLLLVQDFRIYPYHWVSMIGDYYCFGNVIYEPRISWRIKTWHTEEKIFYWLVRWDEIYGNHQEFPISKEESESFDQFLRRIKE